MMASTRFASNILRCMAFIFIHVALLTNAAPHHDGHDHDHDSNTSGSPTKVKKLSAAQDCAGVVAFSSAGVNKIKDEETRPARLSFLKDLTDRAPGWDRTTGEFTVHCPGLYQLTFSSAGPDPAAPLRVSLKLKLANNETWKTVLATGNSGGASSALLDLEVGDSVALWLEEGLLREDTSDVPFTSFSGFRIAKKL